MAENREQRPDRSAKGVIAEKHVPVNADENTAVPGPSSDSPPRWREPQGIQKGIADADKKGGREAARLPDVAGARNEMLHEGQCVRRTNTRHVIPARRSM
jgi:hypothetical protein